jgi:hypothetical protein
MGGVRIVSGEEMQNQFKRFNFLPWFLVSERFYLQRDFSFREILVSERF